MTRIGIVGVGAISGIYLQNITNMFKDIEIIGVCDLIRERAEKAVKEYNICYCLCIWIIINANQLITVFRIPVNVSIKSAEDTVRFSPGFSDAVLSHIKKLFVCLLFTQSENLLQRRHS